MAKQIWVRKGQEVRGPFSVAQIRQLAQSGKLTALHEVSTDQKRWKPARDVPGLGLGEPLALSASASAEGFRAEAPLSEQDLLRVLVATKDDADAIDHSQVNLRLDPDDLDRLEESFSEIVEEEVRRSVPGVLLSVAIHAVVFLGLWFLRVQLISEEDFAFEGSWKTIGTREQTAVIPPEQRNIDLKAMNLTPQNPPNPGEEKPLQPLNDAGPALKQLVPVQPVEVGGLFEGRSEESRQRILKETDNGPRIEQAISQGLAWLARQQQPAGNWQLHTGYPDASEWPDIKTDTGATALALLAFLGNGQTHKNAKDKATEAVVQKGLDWLIGIQNETATGIFTICPPSAAETPRFMRTRKPRL